MGEYFFTKSTLMAPFALMWRIHNLQVCGWAGYQVMEGGGEGEPWQSRGGGLDDGHESKQLLGEPGVEEEMIVWPGSLLIPTTGTAGGR